MEYLELGDLHHYLQDKAPLPEPDVRDISHQILDGLCLMHGNGFAHRDLKLKVGPFPVLIGPTTLLID